MKVSVSYGKTISMPGMYGGDRVEVTLQDCAVNPGETIEAAVTRVGLGARACWVLLMLRALQDRMNMGHEALDIQKWLVEENKLNRHEPELVDFLTTLAEKE